ncbi:MAG: periplasmic heavy metal sensor [Verrucomicrobiota bacterium]
MKRAAWILIAGLAGALLSYGICFSLGSARYRCLMDSPTPELAWLQTEFRLSDAEFQRITNLHAAYAQGCAERCREIDAKNAELASLLAATNTVTPEIERVLQETARLRAACQAAMLQHFYEVSRTMPPEQGRRYLAWVTSKTFGSEHERMTAAPAAHEHHHE